MHSSTHVCTNAQPVVHHSGYYYSRNPNVFCRELPKCSSTRYHGHSPEGNNLCNNINQPVPNLNYVQYAVPPPGYFSNQSVQYAPCHDVAFQPFYSMSSNIRGHPRFHHRSLPVRNTLSKRNNHLPHVHESNGNRSIKSEKYHCSSCDKDFYNELSYDKHLSEHMICKLDGCTFSAHPKVVEKHISMQHRNGLFNRIVKGNSPEEIEKWITERKKQYPTSMKIAEKQFQKEEMEKRGERYNDGKGKFFKNRKLFRGPMNGPQQDKRKKTFNTNPRHRGHRVRRNERTYSQKEEMSEIRKPKGSNPHITDEDDCISRNLQPFRGIDFYDHCDIATNSEVQAMISEDINLFSDDEWNVLNDAMPESSSLTEMVVDKSLASSYSENLISCQGQSPREAGTARTSICEQVKNSLDLIRGYDSCDDSDEEITESQRKLIGSCVKNNVEDNYHIKYVSKLQKIESSSFNALKSQNIETKSFGLDVVHEINNKHSSYTLVTNYKLNNPVLKKFHDMDDGEDSSPEEFSSKEPVTKSIVMNIFNSKKNSPDVLLDQPKLNLLMKNDNNSRRHTLILPLPEFITENSDSEKSKDVEKESVVSISNSSIVNDIEQISPGESKKQTRKRKRQEKSTDKKDIPQDNKKDVDEKVEKPQGSFQGRRYRPPSLLEKLLAPEIKHERNVILQCVRFVVNKDYFGIGQQKNHTRTKID